MTPEKKELQEIHPAERNLLEFMRRLQYGTLTVYVQNGLPIRVENPVESVKLI